MSKAIVHLGTQNHILKKRIFFPAFIKIINKINVKTFVKHKLSLSIDYDTYRFSCYIKEIICKLFSLLFKISFVSFFGTLPLKSAYQTICKSKLFIILQIEQKGMTYVYDFSNSFPLFSFLLIKKKEEEKENELAKIVIKGHAFLLNPFYNFQIL